MRDKKFKVGDEIVIVKNLWYVLGGEPDEYYHGYTVKEVPLKTKGKIAEIRSEELCILDLSGNLSDVCDRFYAYPDEIVLNNPLSLFENKYPRFKDIGKHPLFELGENSPVFVIGNTVYSGEKQNIESAGKMDFLNDLFLDREALRIEELQKKYANDVVKEKLEDAVDSDLDIPQLIYKNIFPYLRTVNYEKKLERLAGSGNAEKNDKTVGSDKKRRKFKKLAKKLAVKIEELIKEINKEKICDEEDDEDGEDDEDDFGKTIERLVSEESLLEKNIACLNKQVYELVEEPFGKESSKVAVDGKNYYLKKLDLKTKELEDACRLNLYKKLRISALRKYLTEEKIREFLQDSSSKIGRMKGRKKYSEQDFGFMSGKKNTCYSVKKNPYYVYLDVPAFAVKSQFDGNYYVFKKTKLAVEVWKEKESLRYDYEIIGVKNNKNPIFEGVEEDFVALCTGNNDLPGAGESVGDIVAKRLRMAKDIFMYHVLKPGYTCEQLRKKCLNCGEAHYKGMIKSLEEVQKMGAVILEAGKKKRRHA